MTSGIAWQTVPGGCRKHRMQLQPVIDLKFAFLCLECGWYVEMGWTENLAGRPWEEAARERVDALAATYAQECEYAGAYPVSDETWPSICAKLGIEWTQEEYGDGQ